MIDSNILERDLGEKPVPTFSHPALTARYGLTLYDAAYLELARRRGLPLATLDRELRAAAQVEGVPLLGMD